MMGVEPTDQTIRCVRHPEMEVQWYCTGCGMLFCRHCQGFAAATGRTFCPECDAVCEPIRSRPGAWFAAGGVLSSLIKLPAYPLKGKGKYILFGGALFLAMRSVPFIGWVFFLLAPPYLVAYMFAIVGRSASGDDEPPDWPDLKWSEFFKPCLLFLAVAVLCSTAPAIYYWANQRTGSLSGGAYFAGDPRLLWGLIIAGCLYAPMALLAAVIYESVVALSPHIVLPAIFRTAPAYLVACVVLAAGFFGGNQAEKFAKSVPYVGWFLSGAVMLYFLMLEMHVLGLIYHNHSRQLGWFPD